MKKVSSIIIMILVYFFIYFLQINFFSWFNINGVKPNLFIVLVLLVGIFIDGKAGAIFGFISGLYTDFLFSNTIGISAILFAVVGYSSTILENRFSSDSKITILIMQSIVTAIYEFVLVGYRALFLHAYTDILPFIYILAIEILFNALVIIILYPLIQRFGFYLESVFNKKEMLTRYF
ncbi:MAG: rod shape-determining protein MreD [Clostridia bacterium]|nr:rod shape-determining protein MreD [Clostridia bacterium]